MLLAIEGITGIGKTTLQNKLSSFYQSEKLVIDFRKHPYFDIPNMEMSDYALEREMIFMLMGYHLLNNIKNNQSLIISDFIFDRFRIFASAILPKIDLESLFYPCFHYLSRLLPKPDLIIRLIGSPKLVLSRIRNRNRDGEDYITDDYVNRVQNSWNDLFDDFKSSMVITINAEDYDFLNDHQAIQKLIVTLESQIPNLQKFRIN